MYNNLCLLLLVFSLQMNNLELIVCEVCKGMFYGDPKDPLCNGCRAEKGWDANGSPTEE